MIAVDTNPELRRRGAETQRSKIKRTLRLCISASKSLVVAALLCAFASGLQEKPAPADPFAARRTEAEAAREGHRAKLFVDLAHEEMEAADKAFTDGNVELGQRLAANSAVDAETGGKAAVDSGKRLKDTEIDLRKLQTRTRDIGRSLNFEDRPPMEKIVQRLETLRESILDRMFGPKKKGK